MSFRIFLSEHCAIQEAALVALAGLCTGNKSAPAALLTARPAAGDNVLSQLLSLAKHALSPHTRFATCLVHLAPLVSGGGSGGTPPSSEDVELSGSPSLVRLRLLPGRQQKKRGRRDRRGDCRVVVYCQAL